jgi:hypothetical protein
MGWQKTQYFFTLASTKTKVVLPVGANFAPEWGILSKICLKTRYGIRSSIDGTMSWLLAGNWPVTTKENTPMLAYSAGTEY